MSVDAAHYQLAIRTDVAFEGRTAFRVRFNERHATASHPADARHGIVDRETITTIREALSDAYPRLTSSEFGWSKFAGNVPREVAIRDLGPSRYGIAAMRGREAPYMVLSPQPFEAAPEAIKRRRRATVVHELVHLLQFESPLFRYWHESRRRFGDPNWWWHEATALATECVLDSRQSPTYPRLWDWATQPERSLESDADGYLAAPFVAYLMHRFGATIVARLYETTAAQVASQRAADVLDGWLRQHDTTLAAVFVEYCIACVTATAEWPVLDEVVKIVGPRAISGSYRTLPVAREGKALPIDHLGCRYFEFLPSRGRGALDVEVMPRPEDSRGVGRADSVLRAELVIPAVPGEGVARVPLQPRPNGTIGAKVGLASVPSRLLLVVANCAFGAGWVNFDGLQFTVSASVL